MFRPSMIRVHASRAYSSSSIDLAILRDPRFKVPRNYWEDVNNQRQFLNDVGAELGFNTPECWYKANMKEIFTLGGRGLMKRFNFSLFAILSAVYPECNWLPWKFTKVPNKFWASEENQRTFLRWVEIEMKMQDLDGWYDMTTGKMYELGGAALLQHYYNHSLFQCLKTLYPLHPWQEFRFKKLPSNILTDEHVIRGFLEYATKKLKITDLDDWYRISQKQILALGGSHIIKKNGGLAKVLEKNFPSHNWNLLRFELGNTHAKKAMQRWLYLRVTEIFPKNIEIFEEGRLTKEVEGEKEDEGMKSEGVKGVEEVKEGEGYRTIRKKESEGVKEVEGVREGEGGGEGEGEGEGTIWASEGVKESEGMKEDEVFVVKGNSSGRGKGIHFDIYVPSLGLAFEYQGEHHFHDHNFFGDQLQYEVRDDKKRKTCDAIGVKMVEVPYWWDGRLESLRKMIQVQQPQLFNQLRLSE